MGLEPVTFPPRRDALPAELPGHLLKFISAYFMSIIHDFHSLKDF